MRHSRKQAAHAVFELCKLLALSFGFTFGGTAALLLFLALEL